MGMVQKTQDIGALLMVGVAMAVVAYLAVKGDQAATGAMISVLSAGVTFFLRGRVQAPEVGAGGTSTGMGTGGGAVGAAVVTGTENP